MLLVLVLVLVLLLLLLLLFVLVLAAVPISCHTTSVEFLPLFSTSASISLAQTSAPRLHPGIASFRSPAQAGCGSETH
jgi:hypothetical protein